MEIQNVSNTLNTLLRKAEMLSQQITEKGGETILENPHPPVWSGKIEDIQSFLGSVDDWLQYPVLRRAKDIIHALKEEAHDVRDFTHLPKEYLLDIMKVLMDAKEMISCIDLGNLKRNGVRYLLNLLLQQEVPSQIEKDLQNIKDYVDTLNEKVISINCGGHTFIDRVKNDAINTLTQTSDFERTTIESFFQDIQTAMRTISLLEGLVSEDAYTEEYKNFNDINRILDLALKIREILNETEPTDYISEKIQRHKHPLLIEYQGIYEKKTDALSKQTLTQIKEELDGYKGLVGEWLEKVNAKIRSYRAKYDHWKKLLQQYQDKESNEMIGELNKISNVGEFSNMSEVSIENLVTILRQLEDIEKKYAKYLTENIISANERKIVEGMNNLKRLQMEMGDDFWVALRGAIEKVPSLILKIEWGVRKHD